MDVSKRVYWAQDALGDLLVYDCSNNTQEEVQPAYQAWHKELLARPAGTVRVLADFENAVHATSITRQYKEDYPVHDRQVRKIACLGVTGGMRIVFAAYRFYARLRGTDVDAKLRVFEDADQARAWLAEPA